MKIVIEFDTMEDPTLAEQEEVEAAFQAIQSILGIIRLNSIARMEEK